jgi:branched-chain amino acid transport system ATP-binding protein
MNHASPTIGQPALAVSALEKRFGGLHATRAVSLDVRAGEIHAVIGPNGAGKTTLISQICGDIRPDSGSIRLGDADVTTLKPADRVRRGLGRSFQITQLAASMTVRDNMMLAVAAGSGGAWSFIRSAREEIALLAEVDDNLARAGLLSRGDIVIANLSHGERKQLELALALAARPLALLLDEPMAGLGAAESDAMVARIAGLKGGPAVLLVEHDMGAVFKLADRITVLAEGAVIASGAPADIRADATVKRVYLGH